MTIAASQRTAGPVIVMAKRATLLWISTCATNSRALTDDRAKQSSAMVMRYLGMARSGSRSRNRRKMTAPIDPRIISAASQNTCAEATPVGVDAGAVVGVA